MVVVNSGHSMWIKVIVLYVGLTLLFTAISSFLQSPKVKSHQIAFLGHTNANFQGGFATTVKLLYNGHHWEPTFCEVSVTQDLPVYFQ